VLDRASTFSDPEVVQLLKTKFIPVALDQWYERRQKDTEGEFYRKIAAQGPRKNFKSTTQGLYTAAADGRFLGYTNSRHVSAIKKTLHEALEKFTPTDTQEISTHSVDAKFNPEFPAGGVVIRVQAKVLGGYPPTEDRFEQIFQTAVSRDNLWLTGAEHQALIKGTVPGSLQRKLARFHLVDNTRGEPPMWNADELKTVEMSITDGVITGQAQLKTASSDRGYTAEFLGKLAHQNGKLTRFDLVAKGLYWGQGPHTRKAPPGKFPLGISFTLADGNDIADAIPPQASRGWLRGYLID
jgi:hypothetical protein